MMKELMKDKNAVLPMGAKMEDFPAYSHCNQDGYPQGYEHNLKVQNESAAKLRAAAGQQGVSSF